MPDPLRVVVATAQTPENIELLRSREPRLEVVYEPSLLGPASDNWMVRHQRTPDEQARFEQTRSTAACGALDQQRIAASRGRLGKRAASFR